MSFVLQSGIEEITMEEYERFPEEKRVEIIKGIIYDMASPSRIHQELSGALFSAIFQYIHSKNGGCKVFSAPFDVKLFDKPLTIVQPDIMIVCDKTKLDDKRCNGAPDFIIEIVSPNNQVHDYVTKTYYYQNSGVREYWIVNPQRKTITVNYFEEADLDQHYSFSDIIKVHIYDDLYIDFSEITKMLEL